MCIHACMCMYVGNTTHLYKCIVLHCLVTVHLLYVVLCSTLCMHVNVHYSHIPGILIVVILCVQVCKCIATSNYVVALFVKFLLL